MDDLFDVGKEDSAPDSAIPPAPNSAGITTPPTLHPTTATTSSIGTNSQSLEMTNKGEVTRLVAIATEGDVPQLYLTTRACQDLYHICGTDGARRAWMAVVTHEHVREMARRTKSCEEEHLEEMRNAFMRAGQANCHFEYVTQLEANEDLKLIWKRILFKDRVKVLIGTIVMETRPMADVNQSMLKDSAKEMARLVEQFETVKKENNRLAGEREYALKRLRETVNIKEEVEADLYGKFALYAKAKKAKIKSLTEALATLSASKGRATATDKHIHRPTAAVESDEEYNMREVTPPKSPSPKPDPPAVPQNSLLGDKQWLEEPVAPPTKRRKRQPNRPAKVMKIVPPPKEEKEEEEIISTQELIQLM